MRRVRGVGARFWRASALTACWLTGCAANNSATAVIDPDTSSPYGTEGEQEQDTLLTPPIEPPASPPTDTVQDPSTAEPPNPSGQPTVETDGGVDAPAEPPGGPPEPDPGATEVCYPGPARDWTVCLPVSQAAAPAADYTYPAPLNGNSAYAVPVAFLDLQILDPSLKVAPNFTLDEIAQPRKGRYAVVQPHAVDKLQDLRDAQGAIVITSGYRSPAYNAQVGGAMFSRHMYGDGFDLDPVNGDLTALEGRCTAVGGFLVEYTTHVHCDFRNSPIDPVFFGLSQAQDAVGDAGMAAELTRSGAVWRTNVRGFDEGEPTRRWRALDAAGEVCGEGEGSRFVAPDCAALVEVTVGARITRSMSVR